MFQTKDINNILIYVNYAGSASKSNQINGRTGAMAVHTGLKHLL